MAGFEAWRATFRNFGAVRCAQSSAEVADELLDQVANLMLALGAGVGLVTLADPESISSGLLGAA